MPCHVIYRNLVDQEPMAKFAAACAKIPLVVEENSVDLEEDGEACGGDKAAVASATQCQG